MSKEQVDVAAERAAFMAKRQKQIDISRQEENGGADGDDRGTLRSQANNPPSVRATDGNPPGVPHEDVLEKAARLGADGEDGAETDGSDVPTVTSKVDDIKAYLDAQGIDYDGVTKKADLLALISA